MTPTIHWPLTHRPHRPIKPTKNPPDLTISPLYDILQYSSHIFSENSWHPLSTGPLHLPLPHHPHRPIRPTITWNSLIFWVSHSCTTSKRLIVVVVEKSQPCSLENWQPRGKVICLQIHVVDGERACATVLQCGAFDTIGTGIFGSCGF